MPLARKSTRWFRDFSLPVSYRLSENGNKFIDASNVYSSQGVLNIRYGYSRYNSTQLDSRALSLSFFKDTSGNAYRIAKVGTTLVSVAASGAHTTLKTGLSASTKHRGITLNNRHIIAVESDGLFSYNGSTFTQLGQAVPSAPTVGTMAGSLTDATYQVALTFYASSIGFETNQGTASSNQATVSQGIAVSAIPSTADNALIDKVRIYLKNVTSNGSFLYVDEISLGTTTYSITSNPTSTTTPPTTHAAPISGGGKYLTEFNRTLVYSGNGTYKNDVFFSETDLPDAFNDTTTQLVLNIPGQGDVTGIATGFYDNSILEPYLVIFKKRSVHIYSERDDIERFVTLSDNEGCVSHDTIKVINGNVYYLSPTGWRAVINGRIFQNQDGTAYIDGGDINDIFKVPGFTYEVNKAQFANFFSTYYAELNQYMTFVCEGTSTEFTRCYVYEIETGGFKPYQFALNFVAAMTGEDASGNEVVYLADQYGWLYEHSINEARTDVDSSNTDTDVTAFAALNWFDGDNWDSTYNFRDIIIRALASTTDLTVKAYLNYNLATLKELTMSFTDPSSGFVLDVSELDEGIFSDGRTLVQAKADINMVGMNIMIVFYKSGQDVNIGLIGAQMDVSKNGNMNI